MKVPGHTLVWMAVSLFLVVSAHARTRIINGTEVSPSEYKEVLAIQVGPRRCTATLIGPKVIATAGHCADTGATVNFTANNQSYSAKMTRSPNYPSNHNLALGVVDKEVAGVTPMNADGVATVGLEVSMLGFGSHNEDCLGSSDGKLRSGQTTIVEFKDYEMQLKRTQGTNPLICYDDSGGPAMVSKDGKRSLVGVSSKGDLKTKNFAVRIDHEKSKEFLKDFATQNNEKICGVNFNCAGGTTPPPRCELTASPTAVKKGNKVTLSMKTFETVTVAKINGTPVDKPNGMITVDTPTVGTFQGQGTVEGPGGSNSCSASYTVTDDPPPPPDKPTCTLTATPKTVKINNPVRLEMRTQGNANSAQIDGTNVDFPLGTKTVTPTTKGSYTATGVVSGPGGSNQCFAPYEATDQDPPPPPPPTKDFAVATTYCGDNKESGSPVSRVCLGVVKKDVTLVNVKITDVIVITLNNGTKEVLPVLYRSTRPKDDPTDLRTIEDMITYANRTVNVSNMLVLDTKTAILTSIGTSPSDPGVPTTLMGRSTEGHYFIVERLQAR